MRYFFVLFLSLPAGADEGESGREPDLVHCQSLFPDQAHKFVTEVEDLLREARRAKDIIRLSAVNDALIQLNGLENLARQVQLEMSIAERRQDSAAMRHECVRLKLIYQRMTLLAANVGRLSGEALGYVGRTRLEIVREPRRVGFGLAAGALRLRGEIELPGAVPVGLMVRWLATVRLELAGLTGPLVTGGDLEDEDPVGWFAVVDVRLWDLLGRLDGSSRWINPLFGYHLVAASIDWSNGDFFLLERGTHVGLLLPFGDPLRLVARYGLGSQESEKADGRTNHVGMLTVEARLF